MAEPTGTKLNGVIHSWQTMESTLLGDFKFENMKELNYKSSLDPGKRRGRSGKVTGYTHGDEDHEADFTLPLEDFTLLVDALCEQRDSGDGFGLVAWPITVSFSDGDSDVITHELVGVRIKDVDMSNAQGNEDSVVKCTCEVGDILYNGKHISDVGVAA